MYLQSIKLRELRLHLKTVQAKLDEKTAETVFELLFKLAKNEGMTVVLATHERRFMEACSRVVRVSNGQTLSA